MAELGKFGLQHGVSINDPQIPGVFSNYVRESIRDAASDGALTHGLRIESMFEAMIVSLGRYSLLKHEDNGKVYPAPRYSVPDFRVVLRDGTQWLVEVKNAYIKNPFRQERCFMKQDYRQKLEKYASATGGDLKLAVYWAKWSIWTLVSIDKFVDTHGDVRLTMDAGMMENELSLLGDRMISTRPPLRLHLESDPATDSSVPAGGGMVEFTISGVRFYCGEDEIVDDVEKNISWLFMRYGQWKSTEPQPVLQGGRLKGIEIRWDPEEGARQDFASVGFLSQLFSRYYSERTMKDQEIVQLHAPAQPGWFAQFEAYDYENRVLPLWQFEIRPRGTSTLAT